MGSGNFKDNCQPVVHYCVFSDCAYQNSVELFIPIVHALRNNPANTLRKWQPPIEADYDGSDTAKQEFLTRLSLPQRNSWPTSTISTSNQIVVPLQIKKKKKKKISVTFSFNILPLTVPILITTQGMPTTSISLLIAHHVLNHQFFL